MDTAHNALFSFLILFLMILLLALRIGFPKASRRAETFTLTIATVVFFAICGVLLRR